MPAGIQNSSTFSKASAVALEYGLSRQRCVHGALVLIGCSLREKRLSSRKYHRGAGYAVNEPVYALSEAEDFLHQHREASYAPPKVDTAQPVQLLPHSY